MKYFLLIICCFVALNSCNTRTNDTVTTSKEIPFAWEAANLYFLLTDRFYNGDTSNDINFNRTETSGKLRGFKGGDIKGITQKIVSGYFTDLGINAIWLTPIVEQIHGGTDEGTGLSYGFHGYWAKDWTALDPNFGTKEDLLELVNTAHKKGIRIILDAVINHTGPVTDKDPAWSDDWVRIEPKCDHKTYDSTITCTLVENLPDIKTETNESVNLPVQLIEKWKKEGRYEQEIAELNDFFNRTGYPRAPRFYIIKWLTDYITEFGIDGYRCDTVKHTEEFVWQEFKTECDYAFEKWKKDNPKKVLDDNNFYLVGEIYNYGISTGQYFDFGDKKVNYFDKAFQSLINFQFKWHAAQQDYESLFSSYSNYLTTDLKGYGTLNYVSSHDDSKPYDASREKPFMAATRLLLSPGTSQVYYGDESARSLVIEGTEGDATLRSFMNWDAIKNDPKTKKVLLHWQKLGQFRANHPAVGAGTHQMITQEPYLFYRSFSKDNYKDLVVIGLDLPKGKKALDVSKIFKNNEKIFDAYSQQNVVVKNGKVIIDSEFSIVLLERSN
ncbi:alpha-amylase family glycosyl hydrolase [Flavivirga amylovorans]|uniref:Alpha-amylase family glycosyl hydrolase n=1 Tax=Flavivirga amylovorans TaxID=870486 RepID=A0ABT8WY14_9FLAO|nr:alpha-amylase family glycosyl hydrolase [Flavivirga amylovorans]MDO5986274.1 alpha-amylase family glycosyl hydrolase [Flavivirga amylovorans]